MKYLRGAVYAATILIVGMYGWHFMAIAINKHADQAATMIILDVTRSNMAADIKSLRDLRSLITEGKSDEASALVDDMIDLKLYMLSECVSERCIEIRSALDNGKTL